MSTWYEILKELRIKNEKRQADIAALLGVTQTAYSRYERGVRSLPLTHLYTLCDYYHVSADYIFGRVQRHSEKE